MSDPTTLTIFAYNVGFGDAFLLRFEYADGSLRSVLIDLGSTERAESGHSIEDVAKAIKTHCQGKLHMVVVTHRHADHLSGFAGPAGRIIAGLEPELVVQPWTEDPDLDPGATAPSAAGGGSPDDPAARRRTAATSLREMNAVAGRVSARALRLQSADRAPETVVSEIAFLGDTNIKNPAAVRNLMTLGKRKPVYAHFGTRLPTATLLPGVGIKVLGPPTLEQAPDIASLASKDAKEYWHLAATMTRRAGIEDTEPLFPDAPTAPVPQAAEWVVPQIDRMSAEELLAIVRSIDDALNNTSLILLFEIAGVKLLFPGDAQIENWRYALFQAPNSAAIRKELAETNVYKVGHHGSLNATPKTLWKAFDHRGPIGTAGRLRTLVSTLSGKHGKPWRGTEVPRTKLMQAIRADSTLTDTRRYYRDEKFWAEVEIKFDA
jgi:hypothetical protein